MAYGIDCLDIWGTEIASKLNSIKAKNRESKGVVRRQEEAMLVAHIQHPSELYAPVLRASLENGVVHREVCTIAVAGRHFPLRVIQEWTPKTYELAVIAPIYSATKDKLNLDWQQRVLVSAVSQPCARGAMMPN